MIISREMNLLYGFDWQLTARSDAEWVDSIVEMPKSSQ